MVHYPYPNIFTLCLSKIIEFEFCMISYIVFTAQFSVYSSIGSTSRCQGKTFWNNTLVLGTVRGFEILLSRGWSLISLILEVLSPLWTISIISKPRAELCNPNKGMGGSAPRVEGIAWGWFYSSVFRFNIFHQILLEAHSNQNHSLQLWNWWDWDPKRFTGGGDAGNFCR